MQVERFTADSAAELGSRLRDLKKRFSPTLAIVFSSPFLDIAECAEAVKECGCPVFGSSTDGEILPGTGGTPIFEQSAVCCLLDPDPSAFAVRLFPRGELSSFELGRQAGSWGAARFKRPVFIIAVSGLANDSEAIIRGIQQHAPQGATIAGGIAGDDNAFEKTFSFSHEGLTDDGIVAMVMDSDRISLSSFTTSGWKGVGVEMTVTSSSGNEVRSIDGRKPVDLVAEYLNIRKEDIIATALSFPMLVRKPAGREVLRTALSADLGSGSLTYAGSVPEGSKIRFSSSFGFETVEATIRDLEEYHAKNPGADLVILFDCCARHQAAGNRIIDEISAIADLWKAPLVGFFTYGEIGHTRDGACDVFNETLSLALLKFT
ncbi:MAG TPA: FIST N-terminal domain-containing protein [Methanoregula sp.]|nr:FIST N-terminal domain-containing protein [Methanoregula sp.]